MRYTGTSNETTSMEESSITLTESEQTLLCRLDDKIWLMRGDLNEDEKPIMERLIELKYAYIPRVVDLEETTPDYGITESGKGAAFKAGLDLGFRSLTK